MTNRYLLTGAGFSKNFGLPLARQVWGMIFNDPNIQKTKYIKKQMLKDFNYELLYSKVIHDQKYSQEREVFLSRINIVFNNVFEEICIRAIQNESNYNICYNDLREFIKLFQTSSVFTLNQDLFLERLFLESDIKLLPSPYIGSCIYNYKPNAQQIGKHTAHCYLHSNPEWKNDDGIMPTQEKLNELKKIWSDTVIRNTPLYYKLHGSIGWKSPIQNRIPIIMGTGKSNQIQEEPLLKEYFEIFEKTLSKTGLKLLIIGYSFCDHHVNEIILNSINNYDLQLHVLNPQSISEFKQDIATRNLSGTKKYSLSSIFNKMYGYYETNLSGVFPYAGEKRIDTQGIISSTYEWKQLRENFFLD